MNNSVFNDFVREKDCPGAVLEKYKELVPSEIIDIWQQYGFGSFKNGFLKTINPDEYIGILENAYAGSNVSIPIFATGMGDIIVWDNNEMMMLVNFGKKQLKGLTKKVDNFFLSLSSQMYCDDRLFWKNYPKAVALYGEPAYEECFGYVPLLGLGGAEKVKNLQKVKIKEQILVMTELLGPFV